MPKAAAQAAEPPATMPAEQPTVKATEPAAGKKTAKAAAKTAAKTAAKPVAKPIAKKAARQAEAQDAAPPAAPKSAAKKALKAAAAPVAAPAPEQPPAKKAASKKTAPKPRAAAKAPAEAATPAVVETLVPAVPVAAEAATPARAPAKRRSRAAADIPATPTEPAAPAVPPTAPAPKPSRRGKAPATDSTAATDTPTPAKPASRRRRGQKVGSASADDQATAAVTGTPAVEVPLASTPASAAATAAAVDVPATDSTAETAAPPGEGPPADEAAPRGRRRRRRGRSDRAAAETAEATGIEPGADQPPVEADVAIQAPAAERAVASEPPAEPAAIELAPPAPPALPPRPVLALADPARFTCEALDPGALWGRHRVTDRQTGAVHELLLRGLGEGAGEGENHCSCADFAASDHGRCPHLDTRLATLLDGGPDAQAAYAAHAALLQGAQPPHSEVHLRYGAERHIAWRPGSSCPDELRSLAAAALDAQGHLGRSAAATVQQLVQRAAELGHRLQVEPAVWAQLGEAHDAQRRVMALEAAYPAGPADPSLLQGLLRQPLAPHQVEAALLAACAGRCVLADEPGLGKIAQVLATLALQRRHFGAERLLVAAPTEWLRRWQRAIGRWTSLAVRLGLDELATSSEPVLRLVSLDELLRQADAVAAWAPDVLVIDEGPLAPPPWLGDSAAALQRLNPGATLVVLRRPAEARPDAVAALVRWLDPLRLGPTRRLLEAHAGPAPDAAAGASVQDWHDLDRLGDTLLPLLLRRRRAPLAAGATPEPHPADDDVHTLALTTGQAARHQAQRERAARLVARWERVGDLASREQRELLAAVRGMSQACVAVADDIGAAGNGAASAAGEGPDPKAAALLALIDEVSAQAPDTQLVVFSQWPAALAALGQALAQRGIGSLAFQAELSDAALADAAAHFRADARCRVALVADEVLPRLQLEHAHAGVVHLDRPWLPRRLAERLASVLPRSGTDASAGAATGPGAEASVPVLHLIAEASIEEALLDAQTTAAALGMAPSGAALASLLAQPDGGAFLTGAALAALVQQVRELLRGI
ncbi:hypothetical protein CATMQ487_02650 [Sphaerotilus microaerophilus]|uniref:SNF2 N-terminal domain-containing protein n=1 Tax=Sphaerotilus microaerophilus TaxID=2914710 RepID=A0ABN6PI61_9BURK|nr:hypothetical protein CATMQ487_02650 [Sphaerotilus sp. FB-5]